MSLSDLQDVCIVIGSIATLDLPMVVDLIGIYELKGPYCTLTTTDWFLQALSVIPRGSWCDVARRFTMIRWASPELSLGSGRGPDWCYLPQSTEKSRVLVIPVGARHKCQQESKIRVYGQRQKSLWVPLHRAFVTTELADIRKEVKAMDEQLATIRSEMLDFRAKSQENHLNLSTQLGFLVDTSIGVVMPKRGKVVAAVLSRLRMIKADQVVAVVAEVVVVMVAVKEETGVVLRRKDIPTAVEVFIIVVEVVDL
ncbi:hypothetical protein F511_43037 [Dorcoceras hygrometricum]|uniref:Uncharacterized protein n=1 Tax=Dorcoceras hygrometricum TaxID=472368 RepID=A0A2Z7A0S5_9LAMI|nr:hypothetical protein F511_43037 [Dorcoceras hygrometricum]